MSLRYTDDRDLKQIFVGNDDEMYALVSEPCAECWRCYELSTRRLIYTPGYCVPTLQTVVCDRQQHESLITKYKPESNSWEDISSFRHLNLRHDFCIVANKTFIYFIGGKDRLGTNYIMYHTDVHRYDLSKNQWDKVADIQVARSSATGAAANGKIFIAGGVNHWQDLECEVFSETTNEWQFVPMFDTHPRSMPNLQSVDDRLYVLATQKTMYDRMYDMYGMYDRTLSDRRPVPLQRMVECYNPDNQRL